MRRRPAAEKEEPELLDEDEQEALVAELDADAKRLEKQMRLAATITLIFMAFAAIFCFAAATLAPDQQGALRCSAAFALIAERQRQGEEAALEYPALGERGREFFVRSGARLMDEAGLTRITIEQRMRNQAAAILEEGSLDEIMPPCLLLLEASGI